jgi:hypothetical protein
LGPPFAVVAVARTVLAPARSVALMVISCHVAHAPVPGKLWLAATTVPLTEMLIGRSVVVPLANRKVRLAGPAAAELTFGNSTKLPITLS